MYKKPVLWHIVGCIVFLALPVVLSPHPPEEVDYIFSKPTQRDFIANCFMLLFFYVNYYGLIPRLYFKKRYVLYFLCIAVAFALISTMPSLLTGRYWWQENVQTLPMAVHHGGDARGMPPRPAGATYLQEIQHNMLLFFVVVLFSVLLRVRSRLLETETAKYTAEMMSLKAQINPHFLFNTLNNIYALAVREKSPITATSILKLSGMMRYVVTESGNGFISLEKEISYINDYIDLQRMRLDKRVHVSYTVKGTIIDQRIAPLTLMPFIENAFKHGVNPDQDSNINIIIEIEETSLKLTVENNKVQVTLDPYMKSGKGIENTKSRLKLLYPGKHFVVLDEDEKHFRVQLTIQLQ